ncbi:hypothetical protein [Pedobacter sp. B4-66]|uniref:hypothetical protein n=1 Tax=Pedobacter sp. B4-66 TaxID=2817280 RepID=UPI001BDAB75E|nr:hypothetical protein [Pedobacter sp. B4-66]
MKKSFLSFILIVVWYNSFAQTNTFPTSGNVGIGTTSPASLIHLNGITTTNPLGAVILTIQAAHSAATLGSGGIIKFTNNVAPADAAAIKTHTEGPGKVSLRFQTGYGTGTLTDRMTITNAGDVGIGTMTPNVKLAVNGSIRAQEIKVEAANWPDYVFAKNYKLPSLKETENHIKEKGHLPGIPSADEVKANGIDLGEMNAKLLKKIEELTLYLIEIKKDNELEKINNSEQKKIIHQQQKDIKYLKSKIK